MTTIKLKLTNNLFNVPLLLFALGGVELDAAGYDVHEGGSLAGAAVGSGHDPAVVDDGAAAKVGLTDTSTI